MGNRQSNIDRNDSPTTTERAPSGTQTLLRGLDVLEAVSSGPIGLSELATRLNLSRSTTHRLAGALIERQYLNFVPREGYTLGSKLLELGYRASQEVNIARLARPHLEHLADLTADTVHLGELKDWQALYVDKIAGQRRLDIRSRVGERQNLTTTGLGKVLLLDEDESTWRQVWARESGGKAAGKPFETFLKRMRGYKRDGHAFDLEENEDRIRCVAAPIRDAGGHIVAAISVTSAAQYMNDVRMASLADDVKATAAAISRELGWSPMDNNHPPT